MSEKQGEYCLHVTLISAVNLENTFKRVDPRRTVFSRSEKPVAYVQQYQIYACVCCWGICSLKRPDIHSASKFASGVFITASIRETDDCV